jgi:hypothetical protein
MYIFSAEFIIAVLLRDYNRVLRLVAQSAESLLVLILSFPLFICNLLLITKTHYLIFQNSNHIRVSMNIRIV